MSCVLSMYVSCVLSRSFMSDSLRPHGLYRFLCPWWFCRQEYWSTLFPSVPFSLYQVKTTLISRYFLNQHLKSNNNHCGHHLLNAYCMIALTHTLTLIIFTPLLSRINNMQILFFIFSCENEVASSEFPLRSA